MLFKDNKNSHCFSLARPSHSRRDIVTDQKQCPTWAWYEELNKDSLIGNSTIIERLSSNFNLRLFDFESRLLAWPFALQKSRWITSIPIGAWHRWSPLLCGYCLLADIKSLLSLYVSLTLRIQESFVLTPFRSQTWYIPSGTFKGKLSKARSGSPSMASVLINFSMAEKSVKPGENMALSIEFGQD